MSTRTPARTSKRVTVRNLPPRAVAAAKAFKGVTMTATPAKLKGKKARTIKRAVRDYHLGWTAVA